MRPVGPEQQIAIIDLGSNTAKLVAIGYRPGYAYRHVDQLRDVVRLSAGMRRDGRLQDDAIERAMSTLHSFRRFCEASGITEILATATSAVRDASNGPAFVERVARETGIRLRVLSGEEEAKAGVLAIANSVADPDAMVVDLGGGSAQISEMRQRASVAGTSWPLGAVRTTERFMGSDPPKKKHLKALRKAVQDAVVPWLDARDVEAMTLGAPGISEMAWIGMGGTLRSLAEAWQARIAYPLDWLHGYAFEAQDLSTLTEELVAMNEAERRSVPGIGSDRADIIVAGAVVLDEIMRLSGRSEVIVSGQGVREGMFYPKLFAQSPDFLADDVRAFSARNLMRRHHDDTTHSERVADLSLSMFDGLAAHLGYGSFERDLLRAAAWVHDVGMAIDFFGHHRHGSYLVLAANLHGYSHREHVLIADMVRWHRKGRAAPEAAVGLLEEGDAERLRVLTGMLRVAEQLERSKAGRVDTVEARLGDSLLELVVRTKGDAALELQHAAGSTDLLASALQREVRIVTEREVLA